MSSSLVQKINRSFHLTHNKSTGGLLTTEGKMIGGAVIVMCATTIGKITESIGRKFGFTGGFAEFMTGWIGSFATAMYGIGIVFSAANEHADHAVAAERKSLQDAAATVQTVPEVGG